MNSGLRILTSSIVALLVLALCSFMIAAIGIKTSTIILIINAGIAYTAGCSLNNYLKKKYPPKNQDKDGNI